MKQSGLETYMLIREYFLSSFEHLNLQQTVSRGGGSIWSTEKAQDHAVKVFLFDSIQFLANMYDTQTAKQVLQLVHTNLEEHVTLGAKGGKNQQHNVTLLPSSRSATSSATISTIIPNRPPRNQRYT